MWSTEEEHWGSVSVETTEGNSGSWEPQSVTVATQVCSHLAFVPNSEWNHLQQCCEIWSLSPLAFIQNPRIETSRFYQWNPELFVLPLFSNSAQSSDRLKQIFRITDYQFIVNCIYCRTKIKSPGLLIMHWLLYYYYSFRNNDIQHGLLTRFPKCILQRTLSTVGLNKGEIFFSFLNGLTLGDTRPCFDPTLHFLS